MRWQPFAILLACLLGAAVWYHGEKWICIGYWMNDLSSLSYGFDRIDDGCTRLRFYPFTRPR